MADIILNDPNKIIVNDGSGDSNILDVTWNVEAEQGPVALDGEGNEVEGVTGIECELDGITTDQILEHIDNGGLVRYKFNEIVPEGHDGWLEYLIPVTGVICDGYYLDDGNSDMMGGSVAISPFEVIIEPRLGWVENNNGYAVLSGIDGSTFNREFSFGMFQRGLSSGQYVDSINGDDGVFISQPVNVGFIIRTSIIEPSDTAVATNKIYGIREDDVTGYPIIVEIPGQGQGESEPVDLSSGFVDPISRFYEEYVDPENPKDGYYHISINSNERNHLQQVLSLLDNTTLLNLNKRRIQVWKRGDEDHDYQWMTLSPVSDGCYMVNNNFYFDCSYHCFARGPFGGPVDISINLSFTVSGQDDSIYYLEANICGFAWEQEE